MKDFLPENVLFLQIAYYIVYGIFTCFIEVIKKEIHQLIFKDSALQEYQGSLVLLNLNRMIFG